jgi:teichoic acid transport system permease protein
MTVEERARGTDFNPVYHQFGPHRAGLPNLVSYFRELWHRRAFAAEMSKAEMRSAHSNTFFGQAWLILNPLLLASVYFVLVTIIRGGSKLPFSYFTHLTGSLFVFYFVSNSLTSGAKSVTGSGKLLLNTAFPRLLMPLSAVRTGFFRFLPTVPVYIVFAILAGNPWTFRTPLCLYFLATMVVFSMGVAAFFATAQVYFRDTTSFLPYFTRVWMYLSPVLWTLDSLKETSRLALLAHLNPLFSMIGGYSDLLQKSEMPPPYIWLGATLWAIGTAVVGFAFFISRERDFPVRIL